MKYGTKAIILVTLSVVLGGGCVNIKRSNPHTNYYILEYDPPKFAGLAPVSDIIRIDRFQTVPIYNSKKIIYREKPYERNTYHYHKWQSNPGDLIAYFLARDFKAASLFKAVVTEDSSSSFSHVIEGTVEDFFESDKEKFWEAVLSVNITLLGETDAGVGQITLLQKTYRAQQACRQKNPTALVEAMSGAMAEISQQIISDVYKAITETNNHNSHEG